MPFSSAWEATLRTSFRRYCEELHLKAGWHAFRRGVASDMFREGSSIGGGLARSSGTSAAPSSIPGPRSTLLVTLIMGLLRRCSIIQGRMGDSSLRIGSWQGVRPGVVAWA